jgi:peptidoglycan/xylan/chitin deacetylase (PgdA/CDA1 family)
MPSKIQSSATWLLASVLNHKVLRRLAPAPLTILMYHGVVRTPMSIPDPCMIDLEDFDRQIRYLRQAFRVASFSEAVALIREGGPTEPTVVITFDDGYQSNFDLVFPILRREGVSASIFLSTSFLDSGSTVWTGLLHHGVSNTDRDFINWRDSRFDLGSPAARYQSLVAIKERLKGESHEVLGEEIADLLFTLLGDRNAAIPADSPYRMLDTDSIRSMARSSLIEFGAHTHGHRILSRLPPELQEIEIRRSIEIVESLTNGRCRYFAYPNGKRCDYDAHTLRILEEAGIDAAITTESGTCDPNDGLLELRRIPVDARADFSSFKLSLYDVQGRIRKMLSR